MWIAFLKKDIGSLADFRCPFILSHEKTKPPGHRDFALRQSAYEMFPPDLNATVWRVDVQSIFTISIPIPPSGTFAKYGNSG